MEFWNTIINTALLGTDKKELSTAEFFSELAEVCEQIHTNEVLDKEDKFLQIAAVVFNYRQCGVAPFEKEDLLIKEAVREDKSYCSAMALQGKCCN
jgi:hypothetical protein